MKKACRDRRTRWGTGGQDEGQGHGQGGRQMDEADKTGDGQETDRGQLAVSSSVFKVLTLKLCIQNVRLP